MPTHSILIPGPNLSKDCIIGLSRWDDCVCLQQWAGAPVLLTAEMIDPACEALLKLKALLKSKSP